MQILFGPRRCEGIGLSDGETMERLWSYLRRFSRMTKEMRPSHRIDVLSSALVYYGMQTKEKLGVSSCRVLSRLFTVCAFFRLFTNYTMGKKHENEDCCRRDFTSARA